MGGLLGGKLLSTKARTMACPLYHGSTLRDCLNILGLLAREEKETLAKVKEFFDRANIPCYARVVNDLLWKMVLDEIREGDQDLMILQGEVLTKWREHTMMECPYRQMINSSECLVLTIE